MKKLILIFVLIFSLFNNAQENYIPSKENLEARKWFEEARFGLFVHWRI